MSSKGNLGFPGGSEVKNPPINSGDMRLIPGSGRSPGEGNGNPLQYSCLGNPMDRGAWTEEPGRLQSTGSHRVGQQQQVKTEIGPVFLYNIEMVCHLPFALFPSFRYFSLNTI